MFHLLSGFNKVFKFEQFKTDNYTFRFFYKFALWLHILFLVLLSAKQYFGEPIVCHTRPNDVSFQNKNEPKYPFHGNLIFADSQRHFWLVLLDLRNLHPKGVPFASCKFYHFWRFNCYSSRSRHSYGGYRDGKNYAPSLSVDTFLDVLLFGKNFGRRSVLPTFNLLW